MNRARIAAMTAALAIAACADPTIPVEPGSDALLRAEPLRLHAGATGAGDTYLVLFKHNSVPSDFEATVEALGGEVMFAHAGVGLAAITGVSASDAGALGRRRDVQAVDEDLYTVIDDDISAETVSIDAASDVVPTSPQNPAAAQFFAAQWNMRAISAHTAWIGGKLGKPTTRVGILDTGIGYTHVDLNGVVDLAASRSFLSAEENKRVTDTFGAATNLVADLHFHGTHVAATVASNGFGTAGVTSGVKLVGLKVCSPGQPNEDPAKAWLASCSSSAVFRALLYAADSARLDVVNLSLGGAFLRRRGPVVRDERGPLGPSFISIINRVFNYVNQKGTAVVVAAGNDGRDMDHDGNVYNAYCQASHVICVSALGPTAAPSAFGPFTNVDAFAAYSNFGSSAITVAAPGGTGNNLPPTNPNSNQGWVWSSCSRHSLAIPACQTASRVIGLNGTSMASPHAAGVAALIAGEVGHDANAIRTAIVGSADDLGMPGIDPLYGKGRINAARAVGLQ